MRQPLITIFFCSYFSPFGKYFPICGKASRAPVLQYKTGTPPGSGTNPLKKVAVRPRSQQLKDKPILLYLVDQQPIRLNMALPYVLIVPRVYKRVIPVYFRQRNLSA